MKLLKQLSPNEDGSSAAGEGAAVKTGAERSREIFASFSEQVSAQIDDEPVVPPVVVEQPIPAAKVEEEAGESVEALLAANKKAVEEAAALKAAESKTPEAVAEETRIAEAIKGFTPEQKASFSKGEINERGEPVTPVIAEGFKTGTENAPAVSEDESWITLGNELGYEVKEDSLEGYKAAQDEFVNNKLAEIESADIVKRFAHVPVESQIYIRGINAGLTPEQIEAPKLQIAKWEAMDDSELIAESLRNQKYDEKYIEFKLAEYVAEDKLALAATPLRKQVADEKANLAQAQLADIEATEIKQAKIVERQNDLVAFKKAVDMIPEFMGTKLSDANKQLIVDKYLKDEYHGVLKSHKDLAEFAVWKEYRKEAEQKLRSKILEDKSKEDKNELHNIPVIPKSGQNSVSKVVVDGKEKSRFGKVTEGLMKTVEQ